jgi:predicted  nucleic acid-binding Zn-ribbon protein
MPTSLDPQPAANEIECARCGAIFFDELTRCPKCGVDLYEPGDDDDDRQTRSFRPHPAGLSARISAFFRKITGKPHPAEQLFDLSLQQAALHNDLLRKLGGDRQALERLIELERQQLPNANRLRWLQNAIRHWEQDNQ